MRTASAPRRKRLLRRLGARLAPLAGPPLLRLLAATWRVLRLGEPAAHPGAAAPVYALWHENIPAGAALHRARGYTVMISSHRDGELITRVIERMGYRTVRGSSTRGGRQALLGMLRAARAGGPLVITPDGPRGPARVAAPGAVFLAASTRRPLVAVSCAASRCWRARSWDRMLFPRPFARVVLAYAEPLRVPAEALHDQALLEQARVELERRFAQAQALAGQRLSSRARETRT